MWWPLRFRARLHLMHDPSRISTPVVASCVVRHWRNSRHNQKALQEFATLHSLQPLSTAAPAKLDVSEKSILHCSFKFPLESLPYSYKLFYITLSLCASEYVSSNKTSDTAVSCSERLPPQTEWTNRKRWIHYHVRIRQGTSMYLKEFWKESSAFCTFQSQDNLTFTLLNFCMV